MTRQDESIDAFGFLKRERHVTVKNAMSDTPNVANGKKRGRPPKEKSNSNEDIQTNKKRLLDQSKSGNGNEEKKQKRHENWIWKMMPIYSSSLVIFTFFPFDKNREVEIRLGYDSPRIQTFSTPRER